MEHTFKLNNDKSIIESKNLNNNLSDIVEYLEFGENIVESIDKIISFSKLKN